MRLSRPRVLLRAVLLLALGGLLAWRAMETRRAAAGPILEPGAATLLSRLAVAELVLAGLALATAGVALASLRRRPRRHSLHLRTPGEVAPPGPAGIGSPGGTGPESRGRPPDSHPQEPT